MTTRRGFSLIEILVSLGLMTFLLASATFAFTQMRTMANRVRIRQAMHSTARVVAERLRQDFSATMPQGSFHVVSGVAPDGAEIELICLSGRYDHQNFGLESGHLTDATLGPADSDLTWIRLAYDQDTGVLTLAENAMYRTFTIPSAWGHMGEDYRNSAVGVLPEPRRRAAADAAAMRVLLDDNAWNTGFKGDIGDYSDLCQRAVPIADRCRDLTLVVVSGDGTEASFTVGTPAFRSWGGLLLDGSDSVGLVLERPALIKLRFTLVDAKTDIAQVFSWSFAVGSILPEEP